METTRNMIYDFIKENGNAATKSDIMVFCYENKIKEDEMDISIINLCKSNKIITKYADKNNYETFPDCGELTYFIKAEEINIKNLINN